MKTISMTSLLRLGLAMAAISLWASAGEAMAGPTTLWYNGDYDGNSALYNEVNPLSRNSTGLVYDDFIVPAGQTWTINTVFSNDAMNFDPRLLFAQWEIRSGVSPGVGGTIVAGGVGFASQTLIGNAGLPTGYSEYTVGVSGLSVTLGPGTYYLEVAPISLSRRQLSYILTTSGANAIGTPPGNDGSSYVYGSYYVSGGGYNYEPAGDYVTSPTTGEADFSMGVIGTAVPEPSTLVLGLIATFTGIGGAWLRRRRRAG
jgi:hypothetical protein